MREKLIRTTKICGSCKVEKPLSEFYKHKRDGHQPHCKDCKREESRLANKEPKRREYNRKIAEKMKRLGYFDEYNQRPEVKARKAERQREYSKGPRLRVRYLARWYAKRMTEQGILEPQPCAECGNSNGERHHPDYNLPLLIVWLCSKCHKNLHQKIKAQAEGK